MATIAKVTVGVLGSGSDSHDALASEVGILIAELGVNLLTGGGGGVMTAVSRAYTSAPRSSGVCIGIVPCRSEADRATPKPGYPNAFVELAIYTHLPFSGELGKHDLSRNHINVLTSNVLVALPGGAGTAAEVELALRYGKPVVAYAHRPALVDCFPATVPRLSRLSELRAFIERHLV